MPALLKPLFLRLKQAIKKWSRPTSFAAIAASLADLTRTRTDLLIENAFLRHQVVVLSRHDKRPELTNTDRLVLVLLARCAKFWEQALLIIQPEILLRWHRDLFRRYWRRKSKTKQRTPRTPQETIDLIRQMAKENRLWGAEHIRGELLQLAIKVSKRTIQKYMRKIRRHPTQNGPTWGTFLKNQAAGIWACDFTVVYDLLFRPLFIFLIIELQSRRILHTAVTHAPSDAWTAQHIREATPWGQRPRYIIHDRDSKYGQLFKSVVQGTGIEELKTPYRTPKANAICERAIGSLKRECLDHTLVLHRRQLQHVVKEYANYYNRSRPHQGIQQRVPDHFHHGYPQVQTGKIVSTPVLGGIHHTYSRVALPN
jgi:transposase InsO family protein